MFVQSKKLIPWSKRDYVLSISQLLLHFIILAGLAFAALFFNAGTWQGLVDYITQWENLRGYVFTVIAMFLVVWIIYLYFFFEFRDFIIRPKNIALLFVVMEFSLVICYITGKYVNIYARPYALCALLILLLVNKRMACYTNFCFCLLLIVVDTFSNQTTFTTNSACTSVVIGCTTSIIGIYLVDGIGSRIAVFSKGFFIAVPIIISAVTFEYAWGDGFEDILPYILYGSMSGITSVVYMMAVVPVFEWMFNVLTNYRLSEITDHKSKLIQKLKNVAPGTFNHSLTVASLAESCAAAIGENALLARAAAYYHDIGKIKQPNYFTENQQGINPHDELTPELSTEIIRSHTKDGYELIRKFHLPLILADIAREHHGTLPIQYFYMKAQKFTDGELDISPYCYQGPKPQTKIAAIIMVADGCEAAVRAQNDRSHASVERVVRGIIEARMNSDQFSECEITMKELEIIRVTLEDNLTGVYHERINYPKLKLGHQNSFGAPKTVEQKPNVNTDNNGGAN